MKKLFLFMLLFFFTLSGFSQVSENVRRIEITSGAPGTVGNVNVLGDVTVLDVYSSGSVTLSTDWTIVATGTPNYPVSVLVFYHANVVLNSHKITIFGQEFTGKMADDTLLVRSYYVDGIWQTVILQSQNNNGWVTFDMIDEDAFLSTVIAPDAGKFTLVDNGVVLAKLETMVSGTLIVGNGSSQPTETVMTGDVTINGSGVTAIGNDKVITVKILDENVTLAKVEDLSRGFMIIGNSSDRPTATDVNDNAQILIGDGTDINSVGTSGDVTVDNTGNFTIGALAVTTGMIADANVTLVKLENLTSGKMIVGSAANIPTARTISGAIVVSNTGVASLAPSSVDNADLADGAVQYDNTDLSTSGDYIYGVPSVMIIDASGFKASLDNTTNDLFDIRAGDVVIGAEICIETTAGGACTINLGYDAVAGGGGADGDGLIKVADANVAGIYQAKNPAGTYMGKMLEYGYWTASATGKLTILSSADVSGSGIVGSVIVYYLRNQ